MRASDASLAQKGESAWVWQARGEVLLARGQRTEEFCFAKAVALQPKDWFARVVIARIYRAYRMAALALRWLQEALALNAASAFAWAEVAGCQAALGLVAQARKSYQAALDLDSDCPGARIALLELESVGPVRAFFQRLARLWGGSGER